MRRWWLLAGVLAVVPAGCGGGNESELIWQTSLPFEEDRSAQVAPDEKAWILDVQFTPPIALAKSGSDRSSYAVLVRFPKPIGTTERLAAASIELAPETAERRLAEMQLSGKDTFLRRGIRSRSLARVVVRIKTKATAAPGTVFVSLGGSECLTGLGDEWQAGSFGSEPTRMAYAADCVPRD